jgi:Zn-dependent peptidase ImmA (M78 family)
VAQVEAGFKLPSQEFIESVALATTLPLTFFNEPPHVEFPVAEILLRAKRSIKRREVLETVRYAEHVFAVYSVLASRLRQIPVTLPECSAGPIEAANAIRKVFRLSDQEPIHNLVHSVERAGVCFLILPPVSEREAFCVWLRKDEIDIPVIAAAGDKESGDRFRLSIAHELGHLVMHKSFLRKSNKEVESEAFAFAAELLMPARGMLKAIIPPVTISSLAKLKPVWGVSVAALVRRAHELQLITTRQYHYLFHQLTSLGYRLREPKNIDVPLEKPRLLRKMAELVYGKPINFNLFAAETNVSSQELRTILADYEALEAMDAVPVSSKVVRFAKPIIK